MGNKTLRRICPAYIAGLIGPSPRLRLKRSIALSLPGDEDLVLDLWTAISRQMQSAREAEGWVDISLEEMLARREVIDFQVMDRLRARVDALVDDPETAERLKPWFLL